MKAKFDILKRTIGVTFNDKGEADIVVWAPDHKEIFVVINSNLKIQLLPGAYGYHAITTSHLKPGDQYAFAIGPGLFADPVSLSQPLGVHGPSQAIRPEQFQWTDQNWKNIPLERYIMYEVHTGTFTPAGTFAEIETKLDHLKELGITAIELMPVAQFPGERNWGYDGVFPFAVHNTYGGAKALQHLINTCHQKGFAVILDVVYNHLGPEGNYLGEYGPYFTGKYNTPWGRAINFDDAGCDGVREFFIQNALMWFRDFHVDALRLDAVHAIKDFSASHILKDIRMAVNELMKETGNIHYLIVESDLNDTRLITTPEKFGYGMDAQWIDEFHHALRVACGQKQHGYYADFNGIQHLAKSFKNAYVYTGEYSMHRQKNFGVTTTGFSASQFIVFSQNHDQTGNRMLGERTSTLVSFEKQKLMAAAVILGPYIPLLFMGEEWSETNPFRYFVDPGDPELAEAIRIGRKEEFKAFHEGEDVPDPINETTFLQSKLQWNLLKKAPHAIMFRYYKKLIELRKKNHVFSFPDRHQMEVDVDEKHGTLKIHRWHDEEHIVCLFNFSNAIAEMVLPDVKKQWKNILDSADPVWNGPLPAPAMAMANEHIPVQPEAMIVYTNYHV